MPRVSSRLTAAAKRTLVDTGELEAAGDYPVHRPSEVLPGDFNGVVALDTETSGLYADDGARVATTSVAWIPQEIVEDQDLLLHAIRTGEGVVEYAFPFDQGVRDKPLAGWSAKRYGGGQMDLFSQNDVNLNWNEWEWHNSWLEQQQLVFHNAKFDLEKMRAGTRNWDGRELLASTYWDTMITAKLLWPLEKVALKPTGQRLWGEDPEEQKALKRWLGPNTDPRYDLVPWNVVGPYAAKDANLTIRLLWWQQLLIDEGETRPDWVKTDFQYMRVLYLMEKRGMPFNSSRSLDANDTLERVKVELARELPFVPSVNGAKAYFYGPKEKGNLGLVPTATTPTGLPQLDEEVMRDLVAAQAPHIETYAQWRKLDTAQSMWYRGYAELVGPDGRIRTCFRQTDVRSGRVSVERFQAQALPHAGKLKLLPEGVPHPRELFEFPEGREVDLAQAELRVAAVKAKCHAMIEQIEAGEDLHGNVTTELFGVTKSDPDWFDLRQVGKRSDFSLIFGVGWKTFQATLRKLLGLEFTEPECREIISKWNKLFPEFRRVIAAYDKFAMKHRYVELANGRRRWFSDYELQYGGHAAFNQYVQPSLAELQKDLTIDTEERHPGILVMTVHDSQYLDCPVGEGDRIALDVAERAGELGTKMFGITMTADWGPWNAH